jgi:hypothetical protein
MMKFETQFIILVCDSKFSIIKTGDRDKCGMP